MVSVLIPAYNMAQFLGDAIRSALNNTHSDLEVIVINDGSTDDTRSVVESFSDDRLRYIKQENAGKSAALNHAFDIVRGDRITILDADDRLPPRSIECRAHLDAEVVIGGFEVFEGGTVLGERTAPNTKDPKKLRSRILFSHTVPYMLNACLVSRELIDRVGPFDTHLSRTQDLDYNLRLLQKAQSLEVVQKSVYQYRKHRTSASGRLRFRLRDMWYRPQMQAKHVQGLEWCSIPLHFAFNVGKMIYEMRSAYHH